MPFPKTGTPSPQLTCYCNITAWYTAGYWDITYAYILYIYKHLMFINALK